MKSLVVALALSALIVSPVLSQTPAPPPPSAPPVAAEDQPAPAGSKRAECRTLTQSLKGQDRRDQMQLCIAQARLDCLKQAIDKKIVGRDERREFVRTCVGSDDPP